MMDCGKQAAKSTIPVLLVFAFLLSQSGRRRRINSATAFEKLKLVEAGQRFANSATLTGTGDSGLYWSASVNGTNAARIRVDDGGVSFGANERAKRSVRCLKD
jgi:hypothetical protein